MLVYIDFFITAFIYKEWQTLRKEKSDPHLLSPPSRCTSTTHPFAINIHATITHIVTVESIQGEPSQHQRATMCLCLNALQPMSCR
jgi:hypothetical protein